MTTHTIRWFATLALATATLAGCGDRAESREPLVAKAAIGSAPTVVRPDPAAPAAPAASSTIPATITTPALGATQPSPAPIKAARPAPKEDAKLSIKRIVIAEGVKDREPVGEAKSFEAKDGGRIYAFIEVENADRASSEVTVTFVPPSGKGAIGNVTLDVGAEARWRTWAYTRGAREAGTWTAVVRSMTGKVLAKAPFEITK